MRTSNITKRYVRMILRKLAAVHFAPIDSSSFDTLSRLLCLQFGLHKIDQIRHIILFFLDCVLQRLKIRMDILHF